MPRAPIHPGEHRAEERHGLNMSAAERARQAFGPAIDKLPRRPKAA
jgi:hypothetical protein